MRAISWLLALSAVSCRGTNDSETLSVGGPVQSFNAARGDSVPENGGRARVVHTFSAPVRELSGLTLVGTERGGTVLAGIGDFHFNVVQLTLGSDLRSFVPREFPLRRFFTGRASQWEGIARDGAGQLVILEETPRLYVFNRALDQRLATIDLALHRLGGGANSVGEGLVLLRDRHVVVLKEKDPAMLIELGPEGDPPLGITAETLLPPGASSGLETADGATLVPLKIWDFNRESEAVMADFSEIAIGPDATIYVLSDESRRIARLESKLRPTEDKAAVRRYWDLPSGLEHPEALAFVGNVPIVGRDEKFQRTNLFVLEPLPERP